jgi:hypothetical protein
LKRLYIPLAIILIPAGSPACGQPADRLLFPRGWLRGYGTLEYAPSSTNQPDLGRCREGNGPCADLARYMLSGYVEAQPFGRTPLRHLFIFASPRFSFENALTPIACENLFGIGIELPKNFEFRAVHHSVFWLGPADLGTNGPYGLYDTLGIRWHFGDPVPRHRLHGYTTVEYAPATNEPDLGRCLASTGQFGGANAPCADFARYMLSGYVEAQPLTRNRLRRIFIFDAPRFSFGNNVPQVRYTNAVTPIACENLFGLGFKLPRNLELRVEHHAVYWLGRYTNYLGPADLGTSGPYGSYTTLGVRWGFGGAHESL